VYILLDCAASRLGRDASSLKKTLKLNIAERGWQHEYEHPLINVRTNHLFQSNNKDVVWETGGTKQLALEEMVARYIEEMMTSREDRLKDDESGAFDIETNMVELLDPGAENDVDEVVSGPDNESDDDDNMSLSMFAAQYSSDIAAGGATSLSGTEMVIDDASIIENVSALPSDLMTLESTSNPLHLHPILYPDGPSTSDVSAIEEVSH
jgi:hypothetical protein